MGQQQQQDYVAAAAAVATATAQQQQKRRQRRQRRQEHGLMSKSDSMWRQHEQRGRMPTLGANEDMQLWLTTAVRTHNAHLGVSANI